MLFYFQFLTCENPTDFKHAKLIELQEMEYCFVSAWGKVTGGVVGGVSFLLVIALIALGLLYKVSLSYFILGGSALASLLA